MMIGMKSSTNYERIINVLRKMDEVLNRKGILQYQDRIMKIVKYLIKLQRSSINYVSNFSANNLEEKMQVDTTQGIISYYMNKEFIFFPFITSNLFIVL